MSVYVDDLMQCGWVLRGHRVLSCHLVADSVEELVTFGLRIGLKRSWLQTGRQGQETHFDLVASKRRAAVAAGVTELGKREFVAFLRRRRRERRSRR